MAAGLIAGTLAISSLDGLREEEVYDPGCREILAVSRGIADPDLFAIESKLKERGTLAMVGGLEGLAALTDHPQGVRGEVPILRAIKEAARKRRLIDLARDWSARAYDGEANGPLLSSAQQEIARLIGESETVEPKHIGQALLDSIRTWVDERNGEELVIPTGWSALDHRVRIRPGKQVVMAGRPGMGKTATALNYALNAAYQGHPVLFFSQEMPEIECVGRLLAIRSGGSVPASLFERIHEATHESWSGVLRTAEDLESLPLEIIDADMTPDDVCSLSRSWAKRHEGSPPGLVIVDYLQLLRIEIERGGTRENAVAKTSRQFKLLAREINAATLLLSQLNRGLESRPDKRPRMSDLRESGAIEQDADVILGLYRPWVYSEPDPISGQRPENERDLEIIALKNRAGGLVTARVDFDPKHLRIRDRPRG